LVNVIVSSLHKTLSKIYVNEGSPTKVTASFSISCSVHPVDDVIFKERSQLPISLIPNVGLSKVEFRFMFVELLLSSQSYEYVFVFDVVLFVMIIDAELLQM